MGLVMAGVANLWTFSGEELGEKISRNPENLNPLDFLAYTIVELAEAELANGEIGQDKKDEILQSTNALKARSSESSALSQEDRMKSAYTHLRSLGALINPHHIAERTKDVVLQAIIPQRIKSSQEMRMRYEFLFIYHYLPKSYSIDALISVIGQVLSANTKNYQDVIDSCFKTLKITKPDVYPDADYVYLYQFALGITVFARCNPLKDFFSLLAYRGQKTGPQIIVSINGGSNYDKFNKSFADFVKSGEFFEHHAQEWKPKAPYKDKVVLSSFMRKIEEDLGFTHEELFVQLCSSGGLQDNKVSIDLVSNYNHPIYGALVRALLHKPALLDEAGYNVGNFLPIEEADFINAHKLCALLPWMEAMNYIVNKYKELDQSIRGDKDQALKEFTEYVKTDKFRFHSLVDDDSTPFLSEDLPLPDGFKIRYCKVVTTVPGLEGHNMIWAVALFILAGAVALSYCLFFRGGRLSNVVAGNNTFSSTSILK